MSKIVTILLTVLIVVLTSFSKRKELNKHQIKEPAFSFNQYVVQLYECVNDVDINVEAFNIALKGYYMLLSNSELENKKYLTIVDMSLSSNAERFYVIDMENLELVYRSLVAHGRNSGGEFAFNFSNKQNSFQTSLGFYKTGEVYVGKRGFSMKLDGLEHSNNNARDRGVIIHGADYVSEKFIKENGRLGRSLGCPSLPSKSIIGVIEMLKEGSCLFVYYPQKKYLSKSKLINSNNDYLLTNSGILSGLE